MNLVGRPSYPSKSLSPYPFPLIAFIFLSLIFLICSLPFSYFSFRWISMTSNSANLVISAGVSSWFSRAHGKYVTSLSFFEKSWGLKKMMVVLKRLTFWSGLIHMQMIQVIYARTCARMDSFFNRLTGSEWCRNTYLTIKSRFLGLEYSFWSCTSSSRDQVAKMDFQERR